MLRSNLFILIYFLIFLSLRTFKIENGNSSERTFYYAKGQSSQLSEYDLGRNALIEKKYDEAIRIFNNILRNEPNHFKAQYTRGYVKYLLKDYRGAIEDYIKTLEIRPDFSVYASIALAESNLGNLNKAITALNKSIEIYNIVKNKRFSDLYLRKSLFSWDYFAPSIEDVYYIRADVFVKLDKLWEALMDCNYAIHYLELVESKHYILKGIIANKLNDVETSCKAFSKAGEKGYQNAYKLIEMYCQSEFDKDNEFVKEHLENLLIGFADGREISMKVVKADLNDDMFKDFVIEYCIKATEEDRGGGGGGNAAMFLLCLEKGIAVYSNSKNGPVFKDKVIYYDTHYTNEGSAYQEFNGVYQKQIICTFTSHNENDPRCCPTHNKKVILELEGDKLVRKQ